MMTRGLLMGVLVLGLSAGASAADWPQFCGPTRDNTSVETGLLKSWPAAGPKVLWTMPMGEGFGAAAIRDGQVFVLDRTGGDKDGQDVLRCLDIADGKELWSYAYAAPGKTGFNGSRAVPAVTEKFVFTCGPFGQFKCIDRTTHKPVWEMNIGKPGMWGLAQSPLLYKEMVITSMQAKTGGISAFDQATGKKLWAAPVQGVPYCSPSLVTLDGQDQILLVTKDRVHAVDPSSGKPLWSFDGWKCNIPIPSPTLLSDGKLFITGGYGAGSVMIQVTKAGSKWEAKQLWRLGKGTQISPPMVQDGLIYFNGNTNETPKDGLTCVDSSDGKILWQSKGEPNFDRGNVILLDGMIYIQAADGSLTLVQPDKDGFKLVSSAKVLGGENIWAPMAISNGKLVIRDQSQMKCLDIKGN